MEDSIPEWMKELTEEDWQFVKRLILASGSLKDVANQYGISYPTVRIRLNRLIKKVATFDSAKPKTVFHRKVQMLVTDGMLNISVAKSLIREFEKTVNEGS